MAGFCGGSWMLDFDRVSLIGGVESGEKRRRMDGSASWRRSEGLRWRKLLRGASGDASMRWIVRADRGLTRVNKLILLRTWRITVRSSRFAQQIQ